MKHHFVKTDNHQRLMAAVRFMEERGSLSSPLCLIHGDPGVGKTRNISQWGAESSAVLVKGHVGMNLDSLYWSISHPFWQTHFPPNGWGCHCRAMAVSAREYAKAQAAGLGEAPAGWDDIDERTGAPVGISKGFDYAPGANVRTSLRDFVQEKLITYPDAITTALSRDVTRYINAHEAVPAYVERVLADRSKIEPLWLGFVENFEEVSATVSQDVKGYTILLPAEAPRHVEHNHGHDGGSQRPSLPDDYLQVASVLNEADSLEEGKVGRTGLQTIVAWKRIGEERFRAVFEVRPGKNNRSLALISLVIKKMGGG